ncbi:MAG: DUF1385 domain-containing protein [Candidatus Gracilibacteria bacterium]
MKKIDFAIGGQAVIEGVMMRSPNTIVISVRKNTGEILVKDKFYRTLTQRIKVLNIPLVRGVINLFEMMVIGTQAINFSANEFVEQPAEPEPAEPAKSAGAKPAESTATTKLAEPAPEPKPKSVLAKAGEIAMFAFSLVLAIALSIFLFKFLPLWITTAIEKTSITIQKNWIVFNLIDGILKTSFFVLYIFLLSLIPSFQRIFEYHGAEHKAVFTYEKALPLTTKNARRQSRFHPRCGTSFILIVFVISILIYTFVPKQPDFWTNLGLRLAFLPLIAGIAYEYLKISARYAHHKWTKLLVAPGLWLQRLTTKEPSNDQLEVALNSLRIALEKESTLATSPPPLPH